MMRLDIDPPDYVPFSYVFPFGWGPFTSSIVTKALLRNQSLRSSLMLHKLRIEVNSRLPFVHHPENFDLTDQLTLQ